MWTVIQLALKGGFRTSEFWLAVLGMVATATAPAAADYVANLHSVASTHTGTTALLAGIGAAVISGAYSVARALTKSKALDAAAASTGASDAPSGNVVSVGPGNAALEDAHRAAVVAATSALETARKALEQASNLPRPTAPLADDPGAPSIPRSSEVYPPAAGPEKQNG